MKNDSIVNPTYYGSAFNCPMCGAYSKQTWSETRAITIGYELVDTEICLCSHCTKYSIWYEEKMIFPDHSNIEPVNEDLDANIKADYQEAASIINKSPRGSAALLRLAIQKLCIQLGEKDKDLNTSIGNLVKKGLPIKVQQSLDVLRVIGNEAVHPGEINLKDDIQTASALFKLVNFIGEKMLTEPKEIEAIYSKIPDSKKSQIENRDK